MRSRISSRTGRLVAKLSRTWPRPGAPKSRPGDRATCASRRKPARRFVAQGRGAAVEPRQERRLRRPAPDARQVGGHPLEEVVAVGQQLGEAGGQPLVAGRRPGCQGGGDTEAADRVQGHLGLCAEVVGGLVRADHGDARTAGRPG